MERRQFLVWAGATLLAPGVMTMGSGLRRTAFDQASYAYWTDRYAMINVRDFGAVGDGVHDDTAALQRALNQGENHEVVFPPGTYRYSTPLTGKNGMTLRFFPGTIFQPLSNTSLFYFNGLLQVAMLGVLNIQDPDGLTTTSAVIFDNMCRWWYVDQIYGNNVYTLVELRDINESHFISIHGDSIRGNGILISDNSSQNVCNVHDNAFDAVFIGGDSSAPTQSQVHGYGILYNANTLGTVGGNRFGKVTLLGCPRNGLQIQGAGMYEQWFDTIIADSCGLIGVHFYGGTARIFIGKLWVSANGSIAGLFVNGPVTHIQIGEMIARYNGGDGVFLQAGANNWTIGSLIADHNGGAGVAIGNPGGGGDNANILIQSLLTSNNSSIGITDNGDTSTANVSINQFLVSDGYTLTAPMFSIRPVEPPTDLSLPASPLVSGTVYQNTYPFPVTIYQPAYATTSGTAGTVAVALGATDTPSTLYTKQIPGTTSSTAPDVCTVRVPPGWYYSVTASGATLATATIQGE
jgi:hypothetical protein